MYRCVDDCFIRLFADDTGMTNHDKDFNALIRQAKSKIKNIFKWCNCNKLTINNTKTCFILFHAVNKKVPANLTSIEVDGVVINRVSSSKYLGLIFDEHLNWHEHVDYVCKSLLKYFGIFNHVRKFLPRKLARQLYFAFIFSRIKYGLEVYGNCSQNYMNKLQVMQNKLLKLVLCLDRRFGTDELHASYNILKVKDVQHVNILSFVNKCLTGDCPEYFNGYYTVRESTYNIRNLGLEVKRYRTVTGSLSIAIQGAYLWNDLPDAVKSFRHQKNFKKHIVKYFISNYT